MIVPAAQEAGEAAQPLVKFLVRLHGELLETINWRRGGSMTEADTVISQALLDVAEAIERALPAVEDSQVGVGAEATKGGQCGYSGIGNDEAQ